MMGRLKPESSPAISAQLAPVAFGALPDNRTDWVRTEDARVDVTPGSHGLELGRGRFKAPFQVLAVAVALTLLMACANLAGLLLARAASRGKEIATRLAVGARRGRLVRQLLAESALLAGGGAAAGLLLAWVGLRALRAATATGQFAIPVDVQLDARVLAFTAATAMLTTILFGLAPALRATRVDLARGMKQDSAGTGTGRSGAIAALVAVQIAVALLLVIGATLAARTLNNVRAIPLGFTPRNLTVFSIDAGRAGYSEARRTELFARLLESFNRTAGVVSASASNEIPLSGLSSGSSILPDQSSREVPSRLNGVSPRFFETLRLPLAAGRLLNERDMNGPRLAVINETAAREFFGTPAALGRRFRWQRAPEDGEVEVVGIVKDAKYDKLKGDVPATTYVPWTQTPWGKPSQLGFEILTAGDPAAALASIRRTVRDADPMLPLIGLKTMEQQIDNAVEQERLLASLVGLFGAITLVLACVGLYGMVSYSVAGRTREIGVRIALGADRMTVLGMVARQVAITAVAGLMIGIPAAWVAGRFAESLLYGVKAHDAISFVIAAGIVVAVAAIAAAGPARRAMRIDPLRALRYE
jgi:predicted permease